MDRLILAAPRALQPSHAREYINAVLSDDSLMQAINSDNKNVEDISVPVSIVK